MSDVRLVEAKPLGYGKTVAAGVGTVVGGAVATLICYGITQATGHDLPLEVSGSIATLCMTIINLVAVYFTPHDAVGGG